MFITEVISKGPQGQTYTSILLRESYRLGAHVKSKTLAVLTHLPAHVLAAVRRAIAQPADSLDQVAAASAGTLRARQGESFGAVWTVDQVAQKLGIKKALGVTWAAELSYWQVLARVLQPFPPTGKPAKGETTPGRPRPPLRLVLWLALGRGMVARGLWPMPLTSIDRNALN